MPSTASTGARAGWPMVMTCYKKLYNFFKVEAAVEMLAVFHGVCPYNMIATQYTLYITASLYFTSLVPVLNLNQLDQLQVGLAFARSSSGKSFGQSDPFNTCHTRFFFVHHIHHQYPSPS